MPPMFRACCLALVFALLRATPADAESFLEKLFGLDLPNMGHLQSVPPMPSYRAPIHMPRSPDAAQSDAQSAPHGSSTIRTVCVRTCDGYYFPISQRTSRRNLGADNARCKARCGGESRLFYGSGTGEPDIASMVDLTGRRYDAMNTAFAYRKALKPGCVCRPPPWSAAEHLRHFKYALEDAQNEMKQMAASDIKLNGRPIAFSQPARDANDNAGDATETGTDNGVLTHHAAANIDDQVGQTSNTPTAHRERAAARNQRDEPLQRGASNAPRRGNSLPKRSSNSGTFSSLGLGKIFGFGQSQKQVWPGDVR